MQGRMKRHQLTEVEVNQLLERAPVGRIGTHNENGYPYVVPVHFVLYQEKIYIHGLMKGQKISNLIRNDKVCFEVDELGDIIPDLKEVCDTNSEFKSVIVLGTAKMVEDLKLKEEVLFAVINKYTPQLSHMQIPEKMVKSTGVIEISVVETTGKYYTE